jgi:hypothetical protein
MIACAEGCVRPAPQQKAKTWLRISVIHGRPPDVTRFKRTRRVRLDARRLGHVQHSSRCFSTDGSWQDKEQEYVMERYGPVAVGRLTMCNTITRSDRLSTDSCGRGGRAERNRQGELKQKRASSPACQGQAEAGRQRGRGKARMARRAQPIVEEM